MAFRRRRTYVKRRPVRRARRTYNKAWRVRRTFSRRKLRRSNMTLSNNIGLPSGKVVRLTYHDIRAMSNGLATHDAQKYNLMSIYDPQATAGGHQVYSHDTWQSIYSTYQVLGAKITCSFRWMESAGEAPVHVGVFLDRDGTLDSSLTQKIEQSRHTGVKILNINTRESATITQYFSAKKFFAPQGLSDHQLKAPFGSNPTVFAYAMPWVQKYDGSAMIAEVLCETTITYIVRLTDPIPLPTS